MHKILIVDDEKSVRYSFSKILNSSKYELFEAENFDTALDMFNSIQPDLAIVDIEMPGKTGLDLLKAIKELSPQTPVIIVTAFGSGDRVIRAMKFGAYEYIEKPFDIPVLINLIEEALRSVESKHDDQATQTKNIKVLPKKAVPDEEDIIGESPAIKDVYKLIGRVAASDASAKHAREQRNENISLHPDTMDRLLKHSWPGNIRELENTIRRAVVLSKGSIITPQQIIDDNPNPVAAEHHAADRLSNYLSDEMVAKEGEIFELVSKALEKDLIRWALARTGMNQVKAARLLGISRVMLHERMERFGLEGR